MMIKKIYLILLLFLLYSPIYSQTDSSFVILSDSLKVDSLNVITDSLKVASDSLKTSIPRDTLRPVYYKGLIDEYSLGHSKDKYSIDRIDYRFTGDILNSLPFGYHADLGSVGNPSEVYLYGLGFNNISYQENGIEITNRFQNALDLNLIQSEAIDVIELPTLASGFIYNNRSNPVTLNIITRNRVTSRPYTRMKFYQAPENEGFINGQFSGYIFRRINVAFGFTNQSAETRYKNSELSNWLFNTSIRYMPSNRLNFIAAYSHSKLNMDLNGGVDMSSTPDLIYNNVQADVNFLDRYNKASRHNLSLSSIYEIDSTSYTNLSVYYQYNLNEFRLNELSADTTDLRIKNNNSYKTFGVNLHQRININEIRLDIIGNYEYTNFDVAYNQIPDYATWSLSGKLNWNILSGLAVPSIFVKTSGMDENNYFGYGAELVVNPTEGLSIHAGISNYDKPLNRFLNLINEKNDVTVFEAGIKSNLSFMNASLKYFSIEQSNYRFGSHVEDISFFQQPEIFTYSIDDFKRSGINLNLNLKLWKLLLQTNSSIYFNESHLARYSIPAQTSFGGLYYVDTLFNKNLDLKAGINYKFFGERGFAVYDFQRMQTAFNFATGEPITGIDLEELIGNSYQFDLFVTGTIRKNAIVYIIFENLFDEQYYVVPYYPIQPRGLRIGVAWEFFD